MNKLQTIGAGLVLAGALCIAAAVTHPAKADDSGLIAMMDADGPGIIHGQPIDDDDGSDTNDNWDDDTGTPPRGPCGTDIDCDDNDPRDPDAINDEYTINDVWQPERADHNDPAYVAWYLDGQQDSYRPDDMTDGQFVDWLEEGCPTLPTADHCGAP